MFTSKIAVWFGLFGAMVLTLESALAQEDVIEQWARGIIGVSSGNNVDSGGPLQMLGPPKGSCTLWRDEDFNQFSWHPGTPDGGAEWAEVWFGQSVFATAIEIHQSINPGAITRNRCAM